MKDPDIQIVVDLIQESIKSINDSIAELHKKNVEIKIMFHDTKESAPAYIKMWKAIEHNNYIEDKK